MTGDAVPALRSRYAEACDKFIARSAAESV
jgi:hypothetical protein